MLSAGLSPRQDLHSYAPTQNPIEDIWLQAKQWIRKCYHMCKTFAAVKYIFKLVTHAQIFDFSKIHTYGKFSQII
jgi:transposase